MRILYLFLSLFSLLSYQAWADCTDPAGEEGEMVYNATHKVMQFCNGTNWISMASTFASGAWANNGADDLYFNTGSVGIGTDAPSTKLSVAGSISASGNVYAEGNTVVGGDNINHGNIYIKNGAGGYFGSNLYYGNSAWRYASTADGAFYIRNDGDGIQFAYAPGNSSAGAAATNSKVAKMFEDGDFVVYGSAADCTLGNDSTPSCSSDERLKTNIKLLPNALDKLLQVNGVSFDWKSSGEHTIGVIAQNIEKVYPEVVNTDPETGMKSVAYASLVAPLIESVKELAGQDKALDKRQAAYEAHNTALEKRLEALEAELKALKARK